MGHRGPLDVAGPGSTDPLPPLDGPECAWMMRAICTSWLVGQTAAIQLTAYDVPGAKLLRAIYSWNRNLVHLMSIR
jgi:hypothetical protein